MVGSAGVAAGLYAAPSPFTQTAPRTEIPPAVTSSITGRARMMTPPAMAALIPVDRYPLAGQTLALLAELKAEGEPILARAFFRTSSDRWLEPAPDERCRVATFQLFQALQIHCPMTIQREETDGSEGRALGLEENGTWVLERAGVRARVKSSDLIRLVGKGRDAVNVFRGEEAAASALRQLLDRRERRVCFGVGHGERDPDHDGARGLSQIRTALEGRDVQVERLELPLLEGVPTRCSVLALVGPKRPLLEVEVARLKAYLGSGRSLYLALDSGVEAPGLDQVLGGYGLDLVDNHLVEPVPENRWEGEEELARPDLNGHYITYGMLARRQAVAFQRIRGIGYSYPVAKSIDVRTILQTSRFSWGETGTENERGPQDLKPPLSAAVAVSSRPGANDALVERLPQEQRLTVVGDSRFLSNAGVETTPGNLAFALRALDWLDRETPRVPVASRPIDSLVR